MKFFEAAGGRKNFGFIMITVLGTMMIYFGKLDAVQYTTLVLGAFVVMTGGNLGTYQITKPNGGKKK